MSGRYPYPVEPAIYESLWGYTHRLANENLLDRHVWLRQDVGVVGNAAGLGETQIGKLSELSGVRVDTLRQMQHGDSGMLNATFFGNEIRRRRLEFVRSRLCPLCFAESGHHNRIFDLRILRACPIHEIELVEFCPTCGTGLTWQRNAIPCCSHGDTLWSENELVFEPRRVKRPLRAERLIFERCRQPIGDESVLATLPPPVHSLTLEGQLALLALLGDASRDFPESYRRGRQRRYDNIRTWDMLNDGLELAEGLPGSLADWLTSRYDPSGNGPSDMGKRIQPLQHALSDSKPSEVPALRLLLRPLTEFARQKGHSGKITSRWVEPPDPTQDELSLLQAADLMGRGLRQAKAIATREGWASFRPKQDVAATLVSRASVERWLEEGGDDLTCREAARLLGIVEVELMGLAKHRIIGAPRSGHNSDKITKRNWHFKRYSIQRLKTRLKVNLTTKVPAGLSLSYRDYRAMTRGPSASYWKLIKAVFGGRIKPVRWPDTNRLEDVTFQLKGLDIVLRGTEKRGPRKLKKNRVPAGQKTYSLTALQIRFCTSKQNIKAAIRGGHLQATNTQNGDPTVSSADLAKFEEKYVFIRRVAKDRKSPCIVKFGHDLRKVGILPVACVSGSADSALYRVADVKAMPDEAA